MTASMLASTQPQLGVGLTQKAVRVFNRSSFDAVVEGDVLGFDFTGASGTYILRGGDANSVWGNVTEWRPAGGAPNSPLMTDCGIPLAVAPTKEPVKIGQLFSAWVWSPKIIVHFHQVDSSGGAENNERFPGDHGIVHAIPPQPPDQGNLSLEWTDDFVGISAEGTRTVARSHVGRPNAFPTTPFWYQRATFNGWEEIWSDNGL